MVNGVWETRIGGSWGGWECFIRCVGGSEAHLYKLGWFGKKVPEFGLNLNVIFKVNILIDSLILAHVYCTLVSLL